MFKIEHLIPSSTRNLFFLPHLSKWTFQNQGIPLDTASSLIPNIQSVTKSYQLNFKNRSRINLFLSISIVIILDQVATTTTWNISKIS